PQPYDAAQDGPGGPSASPVTSGLRSMMSGPDAESAPGSFVDILGDAMSGMTHGRPADPPARSFGTGFSGAMASARQRAADAEDRADKRRREDAAAEERQYQRGRDARTDRRLDSVDRRAESAHQSDLKTKKWTDTKLAVEVRNMLDSGPTVKDRQWVEEQLNEYAKSLTQSNPTLEAEEMRPDLERRRQELERTYGPQSAPPPAPEVPVASSGGLETLTPEQARAKPKGTRFRTQDGREMVVR
ncbi:MAG: hypothetical protein ACRECF_09455, partial [Methyloceanibacter sp.]